MNISDFEEYIPYVIVERGEDYYFYDHVETITLIAPYHFKGEVIGESLYDVEIEFDKNYEILLTSCSCPYAQREDHCKHQVALLFAIRELLALNDDEYDQYVNWRESGGTVIKSSSYRASNSQETHPTILDAQHLLTLQTKEELIDSFSSLLDISWMRNYLAITLFKENETREVGWKVDIEALSSLFQGFLSYIEIPLVQEQTLLRTYYQKAVRKLIVLRDTAFERGEWHYVLHLNLLLLTQVRTLHQHNVEVDDKLPSAITTSVSHLIQATYQNENIGDYITTHLIKEIEIYYVSGLPLSKVIDLLYAMMPLATHKSLRKALYHFSTSMITQSSHNKRFIQSLLTYLYTMMKEVGSVKEFETFIHTYKTYKEVREKTIEFSKEEILSEDETSLAYQKQLVARKWAKPFTYVKGEKGDTNVLIAITVGFFLETRDVTYYYKIKRISERNRWHKVIPPVIEILKKEIDEQLSLFFTPLHQLYTEILINEQLSSQKPITITPAVLKVDHYYETLLANHPHEVHEMHQKMIYEVGSSPNPSYRIIELLGNLKTSGSSVIALAILDELKHIYKDEKRLMILLDGIQEE